MTGEWWCEAYGPPGEGADPAAQPRCFRSGTITGRVCDSAECCATFMAVERRRVFDRIQEDAATGGPLAFLAEDFTSPDELLGGSR